MILLQGNGVTRAFGGDVLFSGLTFSIGEGERLALVGKNGAGKSTLLKIIIGEEAPSEGELTRVKGLSLAYLAQDAGLTSSLSVMDEMRTVFRQLIELESQLRQLERQMSGLTGAELAAVMSRYDALSEDFRLRGGFSYEAEIKSVLNGFQFSEGMWGQAISALSGGQKTRLALAKMLLEKPQLLILDEPTNHLDIETIAWLENYLKNYGGALLIVSHDRYFLDKVTTETLELSRGSLTRFAGNYSAYVEARAALLASEEKQYDKQQKEIAALEDFVAKNLVRASTTKRAQSRRKRLEKIERLEKPTGDDKTAHVVFSPEKPSGNVVLTVADAAVGYDGVELSAPIDIDLRKGQALAIVGPNGIGKTTLLRSIIGQIPLLAGRSRLGANVSLGYYDQEQGRLTASNTVLDELWNAHRLLPEAEIRTMLGSFLFSGDDVKKTVGMLSGGEKARLLLAKLAMAHDNFLVLDEPTNHLDIDSREALESALIDFAGTILFVSHDRYFINRVATQVLAIGPAGGQLYLGDYDYYLEKRAEAVEAAEAPETAISAGAGDRAAQKAQQREARKRQREADDCETRLTELSTQIKALEAEMAASAEDFVRLGELQGSLVALQEEETGLEARYLELLETLEG